MGTPEFAVPSLRALAKRHDLVAAYTRVDKPRGRGRTPQASPVKLAAQELGIPVVQPPTLRDADAQRALAALAPDVICVAAFGLILPPEVLAIPAHGCLNVHASLLPRHRGAAPIQRAILAGDTETGVVIMQMEEGLDTGAFTHLVRVPIDDLDATALTALLAEEGARALVATLADIEAGTVVWTPQDDSLATYAAKITADDVALDPSLPAEEALRRVRASTPSARAHASVDRRHLDVVAASRAERTVAPRAVYADKQELALGFADGALRLERVKPAGRAEMDGAAFARGAHLPPDATWGPVR
jgi:methionyl-tRNA formyltransferase